ncbi:response regulator transcription factor [Actinomadura decatromicini]|uniref:Response regulator transcription factor n=2 Tax=Actinomadura decatromicini TaxID=2604572 RepID=A0A5D3FRF3_9ACTN|nr:response regulator transcription factor [Actinomadura decatromicini]
MRRAERPDETFQFPRFSLVGDRQFPSSRITALVNRRPVRNRPPDKSPPHLDSGRVQRDCINHRALIRRGFTGTSNGLQLAVRGLGHMTIAISGNGAAFVVGENAFRVVLVGSWRALTSTRPTAVHDQDVEIHPCADPDVLAPLVHTVRAGWMLAGQQLDDSDIHRMFCRAKAIREDLSLAILGQRRDWRRCERWLRRGCRVYLEDTVEVDRMAEAIRAAERLRINVSDQCFFRILQERSLGPAPHLTQREHEVLDLLRRGLRNRDIAGALHVTENTIEYHMRHLLSKFGARNRLEVVERATALGLA